MRLELLTRAIFFLIVFPINAWASSHWSFVSGSNYFRTLDRLLSRNNLTHVRVMHPIFKTRAEGKPEGATDKLLKRLIELHRRGTKVEVLLDGTNANFIRFNKVTADRLNDAGIDARVSESVASDVRLIAVQSRDSYLVLSGSTDLTNASLGLEKRHANNETNAYLSSKVLGKRVSAYFDKIWSGSTKLRKRVFHLDIHEGTTIVPDQAYLAELYKLIDRAERRIELAAYLIVLRDGEVSKEDSAIHRLLVRLGEKYENCKNQGKPFDVRVFVDFNGIESSRKEKSLTDSYVAVQRVLSNYGITDFWFGSQKRVSHQKFVLKDAPQNEVEEETLEPEVLFGSTDLAAKALLGRRQLNFLSSDRRLIGHFQKYMADRFQRATPTPMAKNALYYRFFQGFQRSDLSGGQFLNRLNRWLIPATPSYSAHNALVGYLPTVLLPASSERQRPDFIAEEIALVAYSSIDDYFDARDADEESHAYGPLHRDVFDFTSGKSRSLVPQTYRSSQVYAGSEVAYDVLAGISLKPVDWQKGTTFVRVLTRSNSDIGLGDEEYDRSLTQYLKSVRHRGPETGLQGHVILIHPYYFIEYLNWDLPEEELGEVAYGAESFTTIPYEFMNGEYQFQKWAIARKRTKKQPLLFEPVLNECAARIVFEAGAPKEELGQFVKEELP